MHRHLPSFIFFNRWNGGMLLFASVRAKKYQDLLHRVMIGELTSHEDILPEYLDMKKNLSLSWWK
jgi:hypothetical protein